MNEKKLVCSVFIRPCDLDNTYEFYDDGTIIHEYDSSNYPNGWGHREVTTVEFITDKRKKMILDECDEEHKEWVAKILGL